MYGISIPPDRADATIRYPRPIHAAELERFWGIVAYFYRFIHHASRKLAPFYKLNTYRTKKNFCEHWTEQHNKAFAKLPNWPLLMIQCLSIM